jgi:hypothetical protein
MSRAPVEWVGIGVATLFFVDPLCGLALNDRPNSPNATWTDRFYCGAHTLTHRLGSLGWCVRMAQGVNLHC